VCINVVTVYKLLEEKRGLKMLEDQHIYTATQEILPDPGKSRHQVRAHERLADRDRQTAPVILVEGERSNGPS
jgi:hypothetical protein